MGLSFHNKCIVCGNRVKEMYSSFCDACLKAAVEGVGKSKLRRRFFEI